jgi:1-deoxy-D-xylulose-5-phosphate synthase
MGRILDTLNSPHDLKALSASQLSELAAELRDFVTVTVSKTGGHLAPNLGVVELTLAIHAAFDAPRDKIVWDVGHQAYIHKILTGRRDRFHTLRQTGGISGFPKISESEFDAFGAGHASTAISAALGIATARDLTGEDFRVVAVVGDGALTGGLAFEGMNNSGAQRRDLLVVLNDNQMSISRNVGALSKYLNILISAPLYNRMRHTIWMLTGRLAGDSGFVRRGVQRIEKMLKSVLLPSVLFERLGFRYFGPIDGHDLRQLLRLFKEVRKLHGPILVHVITTKGKGYKYAEEDATRFHGVGSFCVETGESAPKQHATFTEIFGRTLVELAERDPKLVAITAAMTDGTGLVEFAKRFPDRFFDVGIAEAHAVTFAAGLAMQGLKPVVAIYSTFLQRGLDQIIHDVALQALPVIFAVDRGGLVGEDGPTHHGSFDLSFLRMIPNLVVMAPRDENEFRDMLYTATLHAGGPIAIRYPRCETNGTAFRPDLRLIPIGQAEVLRDGRDAAVFAVGDMAAIALCAADILKARGVSVKVVDARFVKPLDVKLLEETVRGIKTVITLENNTVVGGFGSGVSEALDRLGLTGIRLRAMGLPDRFVPHGGLKDLFVQTGLDPDSVAAVISEAVS